jgi:hypothetical protein
LAFISLEKLVTGTELAGCCPIIWFIKRLNTGYPVQLEIGNQMSSEKRRRTLPIHEAENHIAAETSTRYLARYLAYYYKLIFHLPIQSQIFLSSRKRKLFKLNKTI